MGEYIECEELRKNILEDIELCGEPNASLRPIAYGTILGLKGALRYIKVLPAADVVEVVRCKDCKFYTFKSQSVRWSPKKPCCTRKACVTVNENDFCSFGERKEGTENGIE